jgi:hypothetical protein
MRRSVLWGAGILFLALACVRLALPLDAATASSRKIIYSFAGGAHGAYPESDLIVGRCPKFLRNNQRRRHRWCRHGV